MKARSVPDNEPSLDKDHQYEKNRMILMCGVLLLAMVTLVLYAVTRDTALLLTSSSVLGAGIFSIIRHYFGTE